MPSHSPAATTMQRHHGLQGPRPATLKVTKQAGLGRRKRPVIIYVESPKVVHAQPSEFKSVVQRLTGAPPAPSSSSSSLLFSSASLLPPPPQFLASSLWSTTAPAAASCQLPADAAASAVTSLGFFISDNQLISPAAFIYDHHHQSQSQSMVDGPAGAAAVNPVLVAVPPSLGACYQGDGSLFRQPAVTNH
ncbi:nuclear speckle RNA-binding protein B-like [Panicum virgatum]|uniref:VQ domain-containing protein n=1 Tax=Panicum virgatum TaxID=38727 RepID=A0A8T0Q9N8_PANVG|nr:nuclear speckle RNA-binding protein B-like [Panicum virgatum]KAG2569928.1 hypothetical protein PVAP13_7NG419800 [Panicum virgatum]